MSRHVASCAHPDAYRTAARRPARDRQRRCRNRHWSARSASSTVRSRFARSCSAKRGARNDRRIAAPNLFACSCRSLKRGRRNRSCSTGRRRQRPSAGFSPSESARRCALRQPCRPGPSDRRSFDRAYGARAHCRIPQTWRDPPYRSGESINRGMTLREANSISRVTTLIAA